MSYFSYCIDSSVSVDELSTPQTLSTLSTGHTLKYCPSKISTNFTNLHSSDFSASTHEDDNDVNMDTSISTTLNDDMMDSKDIADALVSVHSAKYQEIDTTGPVATPLADTPISIPGPTATPPRPPLPPRPKKNPKNSDEFVNVDTNSKNCPQNDGSHDDLSDDKDLSDHNNELHSNEKLRRKRLTSESAVDDSQAQSQSHHSISESLKQAQLDLKERQVNFNLSNEFIRSQDTNNINYNSNDIIDVARSKSDGAVRAPHTGSISVPKVQFKDINQSTIDVKQKHVSTAMSLHPISIAQYKPSAQTLAMKAEDASELVKFGLGPADRLLESFSCALYPKKVSTSSSL